VRGELRVNRHGLCKIVVVFDVMVNPCIVRDLLFLSRESINGAKQIFFRPMVGSYTGCNAWGFAFADVG
jgi:hypothetical protein